MSQTLLVRLAVRLILISFVSGLAGSGCHREGPGGRAVLARSRQVEKVASPKWTPKWTPEQNLFKPVPKTAKGDNKTYKWVYETIGGDIIALDEVWESTPVLLTFFDYAVPSSHEGFRMAYQVDATYGTIIKVVGLSLYDEGRKKDPEELGGLLAELTSGLRYDPRLKGTYDYAEMLGMAVVQLPRRDELREKFGQAGSGTATLIGIGGKIVYEGIKGEEIYRRTEEYIKSLYEDQKYLVQDYGPAPRLKTGATKRSIWVFWSPDSLPSLEVLKALKASSEAARGWSLALLTLASEKSAAEALQRVGEQMGKLEVQHITWQDLEAVFGTTDLFLPAVAVVGNDGHLWYLGNGLWTAEDLGQILARIEKREGAIP